MKKTKIIGVLLSVLLMAVTSEHSFASPAQVIIIRHAEKPPTGNDLSAQGYQHAQELVPYFESNSDVTQYGTPVAIYAMAPGGDDPANRAIETVTPLANALSLQVLSPFTRLEFAPVVNAIMTNPAYDGKMVLVCWEHKAIPGLAAQFGVSPTPSKWNGSDFTTVFRIDFTSEGKVSNFTTFSQQLSAL